MFQSLTTHWTAWLSQASFGQITLISGSMLIVSNVFMTWAWYGHLKHLADKPWWWAALISWGIA
ncbi:MAG: DMT family protein, partial [Burkholderiaceae bacterium]